MSAIKPLEISGSERAQHGCIVTLRDEQTRDTRVLKLDGAPTEALRALCAQLDEDERDWRVISISTPATIYRDLQGHRWQQQAGGLRDAPGAVAPPEVVALAKIKRLDRCAPELIRQDDTLRAHKNDGRAA